jgi:dTDP-4-dehydrorhamnose reductase
LKADPDPALRGTFHLTGTGEASWADFATEIFAQSRALGGNSSVVTPITTAEYPTPARRPANSRLSGDKLAATYGIRLPGWKSSTEIAVKAILKNAI